MTAAPAVATQGKERPQKVTLRLPRGVSAKLAERAEAAGLSRGDYVATVLKGTPAPPFPRDHAACVQALGLSTDGLAVLSKDAGSLVLLDHENSPGDMIRYVAGSVTVREALSAHLRVASQLLADLRAEAAHRSRALQSTRRSQET